MLIFDNGNYVAVDEEVPSKNIATETYREKVVSMIRGRYTADDELALERQRDIKPVEFSAYYEFCEECKRQAK
ncbi:MAG: hypothetical protein RR177_00035, partial [Oscillospiraceae bacterium]